MLTYASMTHADACLYEQLRARELDEHPSASLPSAARFLPRSPRAGLVSMGLVSAMTRFRSVLLFRCGSLQRKALRSQV